LSDFLLINFSLYLPKGEESHLKTEGVRAAAEGETECPPEAFRPNGEEEGAEGERGEGEEEGFEFRKVGVGRGTWIPTLFWGNFDRI
jgi:hypothetical protein